MWRKDGEPIWNNPDLLAPPGIPLAPFKKPKGAGDEQRAGEFICELADRLEVDGTHIRPAYEDVFHVLDTEQKLPVDVDPRAYDLDLSEDRRRLAKTLERGLSRPVGFVLPLTKAWWQANGKWTSGPWPFRSQRLFLIPGDSPIGLRLPLESLPVRGVDRSHLYQIDPFAERHPLPGYQEIRQAAQNRMRLNNSPDVTIARQDRARRLAEGDVGAAGTSEVAEESETPRNLIPADGVVRTALCVESRGGFIHVFMPPTSSLEDYLELIACIEDTAEAMQQPVVIEGYLPPHDPRLEVLKVTPDPGVIEVNIQPAHSWEQLKDITTGVYEDARQTRLGTEKFQLDGRHTERVEAIIWFSEAQLHQTVRFSVGRICCEA